MTPVKGCQANSWGVPYFFLKNKQTNKNKLIFLRLFSPPCPLALAIHFHLDLDIISPFLCKHIPNYALCCKDNFPRLLKNETEWSKLSFVLSMPYQYCTMLSYKTVLYCRFYILVIVYTFVSILWISLFYLFEHLINSLLMLWQGQTKLFCRTYMALCFSWLRGSLEAAMVWKTGQGEGKRRSRKGKD